MLRVRLKADGRLVEVLPGGEERDISSDPVAIATAAHAAARAAESRERQNAGPTEERPARSAQPAPKTRPQLTVAYRQEVAPATGVSHQQRDRYQDDAVYVRNVRSQTGLTQAAFAARIGVPVETVRNWEQGKRSPRGPARALLRVIEQAPEAAFAILGPKIR